MAAGIIFNQMKALHQSTNFYVRVIGRYTYA